MKWWPFQKQQPTTRQPERDAELTIGDPVDLNRIVQNLAVEYVRSIYLWRCVDMIGSMAASVPLEVEKENGEDITAAEEAIEELLRRPNPQWTGHALQYFIAASIAVTNKAYLLRVRGNGNMTQELWPLQTNEVTPVYQLGTRIIDYFQVQWGSEIRKFPVDADGESDVIYMRRPSLNAQTEKHSPAAIAAAPAEVFTRVLQRCADIVSNSSNITGLLSTESEMAKGEVQKIKDKISAFKTGQEQSGGTLVTANAKWNLTRLSEDPASALSVDIKDSLARDVCMTFGVPTQLVGLPGTDTYNNLMLARVGFLTDTVLPAYIGLYVSGLNHALMRNGAEIRPDLEAIPAMIAGRQQLAEMASKATMLSINEQRALLGYSEYEADENGIEDIAGMVDYADMPVKLLELRIKLAAVEAQMGGVSNLLGGTPT